MIDYRSFSEQLLKPVIARKIWLHVGERRLSFVSKHELNFSKLDGLKSRCRLKPVSETRERRRRHCLENVHLRHKRLHDCPHALERMNRTEQIASGEVSLNFLELMQQLLEPQLVGLMDDDEQHLVVLGRGGARLLESQQLLKIEITGIR